jgi:hypothetical protein
MSVFVKPCVKNVDFLLVKIALVFPHTMKANKQITTSSLSLDSPFLCLSLYLDESLNYSIIHPSHFEESSIMSNSDSDSGIDFGISSESLQLTPSEQQAFEQIELEESTKSLVDQFITNSDDMPVMWDSISPPRSPPDLSVFRRTIPLKLLTRQWQEVHIDNLTGESRVRTEATNHKGLAYRRFNLF